ncbi:hypothetical protein [uncultured Sphingomonas sp.]|uniref:hypothetical protein n=1 Tax=uncultured Sphingomonas sp. TaxID=158754 RepID=UPI0025E24B0A|nr:hypothetical protein [uncultured Sphingomonas sp.]
MKADAPFKRLRFEYDPDRRESVIGALAAACREHRLPRIATALEGGGVHVGRVGSIQCAPPDTLGRIARIMRTDPANLDAIAFARSDRRDRIVLGDLVAPRSAFDLERRRIGPVSLRKATYHRSDWLNLLLPYCPESLELLVDACPDCGPLGWRWTRGLDACEGCGKHIAPSEAAPLPPHAADDYRLLADLMSRDQAAGGRAIEQLPPNIQSFSRSALVGVALRAGIVATSGRGRCGVEKLIEAGPETVAKVVASGAALLRGWPASMQAFADARLEAIAGDVIAYETMRRDIRWIAQRSDDEERRLVGLAFRDIDGRKVQTFAKDTRYYTATETNIHLWTSSQQLKQLRNARALGFEELPGGQRKRVRYDADDVDGLRTLLRSSTTPESAAARFELPVYAIAQMAFPKPAPAAGEGKVEPNTALLTALDHPGVVMLQGQKLNAASVEDLARELDATAIRRRPPQGFVPLRNAMIRYPGEKPWGRVLRAMLGRRIPYYVDGTQAATARSMHVDPARLPALSLSQQERGDSFLSFTHVSMRDAGEILGAGFEETAAAIASRKIEITRHGKGNGVSRDAVNALAGIIAFTGEAAVVSNRNAVGLYHELKRGGVARLHGGWSRRALVNLGLVSPLRHPGADQPRERSDELASSD